MSIKIHAKYSRRKRYKYTRAWKEQTKQLITFKTAIVRAVAELFKVRQPTYRESERDFFKYFA